MQRISLGLLTGHKDYAERLMAYIRTSEYRDRISIVWFTNVEIFMKRLEIREPIQVLAVDEDFFELVAAGTLVSDQWKTILLVDCGDKPKIGFPALGKYQPLNRLMDQILEENGLLEIIGAPPKGGGGRSYMISVYSAVGGAGKTVFAYSAASLLARMGYKPVLVSLETVPSPCWIPHMEEDGFGRALYYAVSGSEPNPGQIDKYLLEDSRRRVLALPAARCLEELEQMGLRETERLLDGLAASNKADVVILDLDSVLHPRVLSALKRSDKIVCLAPDDGISACKTKRILLHLQEREMPDLRKKMSVIMNRCAGSPAMDDSMYGFEPEDALPFQPEWVHLTDIGKLEDRTLYHERLHHWLANLMNHSCPIPNGGGMK